MGVLHLATFLVVETNHQDVEHGTVRAVVETFCVNHQISENTQEFEFSTRTKSSIKTHDLFDKSVSNCQVGGVLAALLRN